jgi:hypothetical protein
MDYSRMVLFTAEAEKEGLENSPDAQELLSFVRLQVMTELLNRNLRSKAQPSPAEVQKYYDDNKDHYLQLELEKVVLPIRQSGDPAENKQMKDFADNLRKRAAAGGDFTTLQKEASEQAGQQNPPETKVTMSPGQVPQSHQAVLKLKPGEVSEVIQDGVGFYIYKLLKQDYTPFDQVKAQIQDELAKQKLQQEQSALLQRTTPLLNPDYFGSATPASLGGIKAAPGGASAAQGGPPPKS